MILATALSVGSIMVEKRNNSISISQNVLRTFKLNQPKYTENTLLSLRYDMQVFNVQSKKLTDSQLSLSHRIRN